jgi:glycosyltransferase involved in cell wall biosynthesis
MKHILMQDAAIPGGAENQECRNYKPKKILIVGLYNILGGIEVFAKNYISAIDKKLFSFDILSMYEHIQFETEFREMGCTIVFVPHYKHIFWYILKLASLIKKNGYDIVHINLLSAANLLPLIIARLAGVKVVITHSHSAGIPDSLIKKILHRNNKYILPFFATNCFACSSEAGYFLYGKKTYFEIIHNAIYIERFLFSKTARNRIRNKLGIADDTIVLGHIGRFIEVKNHHFLIEVFKNIIDRGVNAVLLLVGAGSLHQQIQDYVNYLGLSNEVIFYGTTNIIQEIYSAMDIFIFPSIYEGLPIVGIEAQCSGLPSIFSTAVSREIQVSDLILWRDLSIGPQKWADAVFELLPLPQRKDMSEVITNAGYNILSESKKLAHRYYDLINTNK